MQVTKDRHVFVSHDTRVNADNCRDTKPPVAGEPFFPYAGKPWALQSLQQVKTLECGYAPPRPLRTRPPSWGRFPSCLRVRPAQEAGRRHRVGQRRDQGRVGRPRGDGSPKCLAERTWAVIRGAGMTERVTIQSFDWPSLRQVHSIAPCARLVALASSRRLQVGESGASPWLGGVDIDDVGGNLVRAAQTIRVLRPSLAQLHAARRRSRGRAGPRHRPRGDPLDRRRAGRHEPPHRAWGRRHHHQPARRAAAGSAARGGRASEGVSRALTARGMMVT